MDFLFNHVAINLTNNLKNNHAVGGFEISLPQYPERLLDELKNLTQNPDVQSYFRYKSFGQYEGKYCINGYLLPQSEPYRNGAFEVRIRLSEYFPFGPSELQLLTPIYHPAVNGDISKPEFCCKCCSFKDKPASYISDLIKHYVNVLDDPDNFSNGCDYNCEARELYRKDRARYNEKALEMVTKYAYPRQINQ